jgi:DNA-binding transcriptional LysR family regulator
MRIPHVTLEQWRVLQAVVDHGGYAQAAAALHRSQSSISYAIARLQSQLGIPLLEIRGRKAVLTEAGETLLRRSRQLLQEALALEDIAQQLKQGREPEIRLVVDVAFPSALLTGALQTFAPQDQGTRVLLEEVVLSGAAEALEEGNADLVIGAELPGGFLSDALLEIEFIAVAHPQHPLHQLGRELTMSDLEKEMQVVVKDSGQRAPRDIGWLGAEQRWTVSSMDTAVTTVSSGLGYGWLPRHQIGAQLNNQQLRPLPLKSGRTYSSQLYLTYGQEHPGPATRLLGELLKQQVQDWQ